MLNKEIKLKPCPFCGGEAEVSRFLGRYAVVCTECFACMLNEDNYFPEDEKSDIDFVVRSWNRRVDDAE